MQGHCQWLGGKVNSRTDHPPEGMVMSATNVAITRSSVRLALGVSDKQPVPHNLSVSSQP